MPHEIDRPLLRSEIWAAADMIKWSLDDDHMICSAARKPRTSCDTIATKLDSVLAHDPREWTEARD